MSSATAPHRRRLAPAPSIPPGAWRESPLVRSPQYGGDAFFTIAELPGYLLETLLWPAHVTQAARNVQPRNEAADALDRVPAGGLFWLTPAVLWHPVTRHFQARREGDAGGVAVGAP